MWMATLGIQDVCFHLNIHQMYQTLLRFTVGLDHYQFKVLPFGLTLTPRVFTKTIVVITAYLHLQGIIISPCIDDWLLVMLSKDLLLSHLSMTILRHSLGNIINYKKLHHPRGYSTLAVEWQTHLENQI